MAETSWLPWPGGDGRLPFHHPSCASMCARYQPMGQAEPTLQYVGDGQGEYMRETIYQFVGSGEGDHEKRNSRTICGFGEDPSESCCPRCCSCCSCCECSSGRWLHTLVVAGLLLTSLTLLLALAAIVGWDVIFDTAATGMGSSFDCSTDPSEARWSDEQQKWCCRQQGSSHICESMLSVYDCAVGREQWRQGWSPEKQEQCCRRSAAGTSCEEAEGEAAAVVAPRFEAAQCRMEIPERIPQHWTVERRQLCCYHLGIGCLGTAELDRAVNAITSGTVDVGDHWPLNEAHKPYTCSGGDSSQLGWSAGKAVFCCQLYGLACPSPADVAGPPRG